jgi:hypothetical protein
MNRQDEKLVHDVFNVIKRCKPSLEKYLAVDEDEKVDVRELADAIIKAFPWPIGNELRRLFSPFMMNMDRWRLDQLFKIVERTMQFAGFVMVTQLLEETLKQKITIPTSYAKEFKKHFLVLAMGDFAWLIRETGKLFANFNITPFMPEMADLLHKDFYKSLDYWVSERNIIGHHQVNLTSGEIEKRCVEYQEQLVDILKQISFLSKYKMVTMREIEVIKSKRKHAKFHHTIDILSSIGSDFRTHNELVESFTDSHAVLILKDFKNLDEFLNLSPLIIDTRSEVLDCREKFAIKKDIFLYTKFVKGKLHYVGTTVTEKCDLTLLSNYNQLLNEFQEFLKVIAKEAVND